MLERILKVGDAWLGGLGGDEEGNGGECSLGVQTLQHQGREFIYLPFAKNGINYAPSTGRDVLSGKFSGCIMGSYTTNGQQRVCHVSTGAGQDCKAAWRQIMSRSTNVFQFKPADHIQTGGVAWYGTYGLVTSDLQFWSITVGGPIGAYKITGIEKGRGLSPSDV
jgi:hypothetical protein